MEQMDEDRGPLSRALERIGDRWSLLIIDALQGAPLRFSDLADRVTGIAAKHPLQPSEPSRG